MNELLALSVLLEGNTGTHIFIIILS